MIKISFTAVFIANHNMLFFPQRPDFLNQLNGSLCGTVFIALDTQINQNPTHSNVDLLTLYGGSSQYHLS